jgi:type IV pilus assembly protein PilP
MLLCAAFLSVFVLTACNKEKPPQPPAAPAQQITAVKVQPKPVQKVLSTVSLPIPTANQFDFSSKKDPFKPFLMAKSVQSATNEIAKKNLRDALPIHSFDVSKFKLIGIITGGRESQAMVTDPNGKGYVLKVGMTIGNSNGKITAITSSGVDVLEQFTDDNGRVRKENIKITLPRKQ